MIYEQYINSQQQKEKLLYLENDVESESLLKNHNETIPNDLNYALQLYFQAGKCGLAEGMNAYAMLIEEGHGIDFDFEISERDRMVEAAKWYYAAAKAGKSESAGNLLLLLTTYPYLKSIETIDDQNIPVNELKMWLHSYTKNTNSKLYEALNAREIFIDNKNDNNNNNNHNGEDEITNQRNLPHTNKNPFNEHHGQEIFPYHQQYQQKQSRDYQTSKTLYSKNFPENQLRTENKILSKLQLYPEEKADYLTNKLKTYSKFSLTSDLVARKNEYSDNMNWNQHLEQKKSLNSDIKNKLIQPQSTQLDNNSDKITKNYPFKEPTTDFKDLSKFIHIANKFTKKRSESKDSLTSYSELNLPSPEFSSNQPNRPTIEHKDSDFELKLSEPRQMQPKSININKITNSNNDDNKNNNNSRSVPNQNNTLNPQKKRNNDIRNNVYISDGSIDTSETDDNQSSELDMEKISKQHDKTRASINPQIAKQFLDQMDSSDDGDLPVLSHQQDRQVIN